MSDYLDLLERLQLENLFSHGQRLKVRIVYLCLAIEQGDFLPKLGFDLSVIVSLE